VKLKGNVWEGQFRKPTEVSFRYGEKGRKKKRGSKSLNKHNKGGPEKKGTSSEKL